MRFAGGIAGARRAGVLVAVAVGGLAFGLTPGEAQLPRRMAALGDSLTVAFRACGPSSLCPQDSWSTGSDAAVNSHALRLQALGSPLTTQNFAVSGKKVVDPTYGLVKQAQQAVVAGADYVTILMGTNDVCRESLAQMTTVAAFRTAVQSGLQTLAQGLPDARIFVASIPDPERLRAVFAGSAQATSTWAADGPGGTCAVFLQDPASNLPAVRNRRAQAHQRLADLNAVLADACAAHPQCTFDGGAVTNLPFAAGDFATSDYFHFSIAGQAALAAATFPIAFPPPPPPPPVTGPPGADDAQVRPPVVSTGTTRFPAKLKLRHATLARGRLDAVLSVSGRATGTLEAQLHAAGRTRTVTVALGAAGEREKLVRIRRLLPGIPRAQTTGILTVAYAGNSAVAPDALRLRAARLPSRLAAKTLTRTGTRLHADGTIDRAVRGVVRLRVTYATAHGSGTWTRSAPIAAGRWSTSALLPAAAIADPNAYLTLQFTGDGRVRARPRRGEQDGRALAGLPAR